MRARTKAAVGWLTHACLGDDFVRVGLRDTADGTLGAVDAQVSYLALDAVRAAVGGLPDAPT
jgi:hypothetical protein